PREEGRQPGTAGPDDDVRARRVGWVGAARLDTQAARELLGRLPRVQHARAGLEQHRVQIVAAERRVEAASLLGRGPLAREAQARERGLALGQERAVARPEPCDADRLEQAGARLGLELAPELEPAQRPARVPLRLAVREADQPRVAARRRADVSR